MKDYYKTLGLLNSASQEEIKRSYRILARRYHPDISQRESSSEKFKEIQNAYNTLKDLDKRKLYDATAEAFIKQKFNSRLKSYANSYGKNNSQ
ncbi:MAG: DnaJ domain-containing protein, partial [bacterium]|nr:DnaJ domain-containing protein [bacterium]